jgi:hypothetical protein
VASFTRTNDEMNVKINGTAMLKLTFALKVFSMPETLCQPVGI